MLIRCDRPTNDFRCDRCGKAFAHGTVCHWNEDKVVGSCLSCLPLRRAWKHPSLIDACTTLASIREAFPHITARFQRVVALDVQSHSTGPYLATEEVQRRPRKRDNTRVRFVDTDKNGAVIDLGPWHPAQR